MRTCATHIACDTTDHTTLMSLTVAHLHQRTQMTNIMCNDAHALHIKTHLQHLSMHIIRYHMHAGVTSRIESNTQAQLLYIALHTI